MTTGESKPMELWRGCLEVHSRIRLPFLDQSAKHLPAMLLVHGIEHSLPLINKEQVEILVPFLLQIGTLCSVFDWRVCSSAAWTSSSSLDSERCVDRKYLI